MRHEISKRGFLGAAALLGAGALLPAISYAEDKKEGPMTNPLTVDIPGVVVPVASGRRLVNYVFMTIKVTAADDHSANLIRSNMMLVKDAIVRDGSKNPVALQNPSNYFDKAGFGNRILPVVGGALLGVKVTRVDVIEAQFMKR